MSKSIFKATGIVLIINLLVRILGLLRETAIANYFGASSFSDSYLAAYTVPYFLQTILGAALVAVMVPILTRYLVEEDKEQAWKVASSVINIAFLILLAFAILGVLGAKVIVALLSPGFQGEQAALTVRLTQIMFPSLIFMGIGMIVTGILNSCYRFALGAFAIGFSNIIIIITLILLARTHGVYGLAWGTLISFVGFLLIQVPSLKKIGFHYTWKTDWHHPAIKEVFFSLGPIILGVAVNQIYFAINRIFASGLAEGTIASLNYANKLMGLPVGIFVAAIVSAIYPNLSEFAVKNDKESLIKTMQKGLGMISLIIIPAVVGLIILRLPIIRIIFEHGEFTYADSLATSWALLFFCLGMIPLGVNMVLARGYYALNDVKTPVVVGFISILINIVLSFFLYKSMSYGGGGLAFANTIASLVYMIILYIILKKKLPGWRDKVILSSFIRTLFASLCMGVVVIVIWQVGSKIFTNPGVLLMTALVFVSIAIGCLFYLFFAWLFKVQELRYVIDMLKKRLGKKPPNITSQMPQ